MAVSNLVASNRLKISIVNITAGQAWANQIRGVYHLIYPWALVDFVHINDFKKWVRTYYAKHRHIGTHGVTTPPQPAAAPIGREMGKSLLIAVAAIGKARNGMFTLNTTINQIYLAQKEKI